MERPVATPRAVPGLSLAPVARNAAALVTGDVLNRAFRFAATIVLARTLSLDDFGLVNAAIALGGLLVMVASLGLTDLGTRDVAVRPDEGATIAGQVLAIRLTALAAGLACAALAVAVLDGAQVTLVVPTAVMALAMTVAPDWILRGLERMRLLGIAWAIGGGVVVAGAAAVSLGPRSAVSAMWVYAAGEVAIALVGWIVLRRALTPHLNLQASRPLLRRAWPLAASGIIVYAYTANLDTVLLAVLRSPAEAGLYSAPYRLFWVLAAVILFVSYAALPTFARHSADGDDHLVRSGVARLSGVLACYGAAVVGLAVLAGEWALGLFFGSGFEAMGATFIILTASLGWYAIGFPAGQSMIASDRSRGFLAGAVIAGVLNLLLNLLLIPSHGADGAAVANLVAFAGGSVAWLRIRGLAASAILRLLIGAGVTTALAITAAAQPGVRAPAGALLLALAAAGLALTRREERT